MKKLLFIITIFIVSFFVTGCGKDSMDNIKIVVTNYPNEYIVKKLYKNHSNIRSVYPDGVDINKYEINDKQKRDFARSDLFIYNGAIEKERNLAISLLDLNKELKIIDTAYAIEKYSSIEELWLDPSSLLMMAGNLRIGLNEYISSTVLKDEVAVKYEKLKVELSELDALYRNDIKNAKSKDIVIGNKNLLFLKKLGFNVYLLNSSTSNKDLVKIEELIKNKNINYIYNFKDEENNSAVKDMINKYNDVQLVYLYKIDNLTDKDRENNKNYIGYMNDNLILLKKELYQ